MVLDPQIHIFSNFRVITIPAESVENRRKIWNPIKSKKIQIWKIDSDNLKPRPIYGLSENFKSLTQLGPELQPLKAKNPSLRYKYLDQRTRNSLHLERPQRASVGRLLPTLGPLGVLALVLRARKSAWVSSCAPRGITKSLLYKYMEFS